MPTLGDLNPDLYKKSTLQLENEARSGVTSGTSNASNNPTLNNTPSSQNVGNPSVIIESNAGYSTMSGQRTASNSQLEATRQNLGQNAMETPGVGLPPMEKTIFNRLAQDPANQFEVRPQDKAPDANAGLYYNNSTGQTNNPGYVPPKKTAGDAIRGFTNNQQAIDQNKVKANLYKKLQEFSAGQQAAMARGDTPAAQMFASQIESLRGQIGDTDYASRIDPNTGQYLGATATPGSTEADVYAQDRNQNQQAQAMASYGGGAATSGATGGQAGGQMGAQNTGGVPSTGDPRYDAMLGMGASQYGDQVQFANDIAQAQDERIRQGLINSVMQTNIADLGYNKADINRMSTAQLYDLMGSEGITMSNKIKDSITANGKLQIENLKLAQEQGLADTEMTKRQVERQLNRSVSEREQFNTQQDTKLRRMLGLFGGGQVQDLAGNMAVMNAQEKGVTALADLRADFGDRMDSLGRQGETIRKTYTNQIMSIQNDMNSAIENAYAGLMSKVEGYMDAGVTNKKELATAIMGAKKEYINFYKDVTDKAATFIQQENKNLFDQMMKLQDAQREEDKTLTTAYGYMFKNGQPVLDQEGQRVPTLDAMKFTNDIDAQLTQNSGYLYRDGRQVLDSKGQPIETFDRVKESNAEKRWLVGEQNSQDRWMTTEERAARQWNATEDRQNREFSITSGISQNSANRENAKFILEANEKGFDVSLDSATTSSFNGGRSQYNPVATPDGGVQFGVNTGQKPGVPGRDQCGEFVNDALGMKIMGDTIASKRAKITTNIPTPGAAFVQSTQGPYGHTGLIESTGKFDAQGRPTEVGFVDSNYGSNGIVQRGTMQVSYDAKGNPTYKRNGSTVRIDGFTDGILPNITQEQSRTAGAAFGPQPSMKQITGEQANYSSSMGPQPQINVNSRQYEPEQAAPTGPAPIRIGNMTLTKRQGGENTSPLVGIPKQAETRVNQLLGAFDNEPQVRSFQIMQNAIDSVRNLDVNTTNPSDDQSLIYAFAKVMDPTSSVKEGEYTTIKDYSQKLFDKYGSGLGQAWSGTGFLSPTARANIKKTLDGKFNTEKKAYDNVRSQSMKKIDAAAGKQGIGEQLLQDYSYSNQSDALQSGEIMVRDKKTGQTGAIPAGEYNASLYDKL